MEVKSMAAKYDAFCSGLVMIYVICVAACVALLGVANYYRSSTTDHVPVTTADMSVEVLESGDNLYSFTSKVAYVSNGQTYYEVSIGDGTILIDADTYSMYFADTGRVKTNIYTFRATNEQSYLRKFNASNEYTVTRLSILGEQPYSEEEIASYTERAKEVLTADKYIALGDKKATMPELMANESLKSEESKKGLF